MANMASTWIQLGAQVASKIEKNLLKRDHMLDVFLMNFLLILGSSWVDFLWILNAKLRAKLTKKSIIWPLVGKLAEVAKMLQNCCFFFNTFGSIGLPTLEPN